MIQYIAIHSYQRSKPRETGPWGIWNIYIHTIIKSTSCGGSIRSHSYNRLNQTSHVASTIYVVKHVLSTHQCHRPINYGKPINYKPVYKFHIATNGKLSINYGNPQLITNQSHQFLTTSHWTISLTNDSSCSSWHMQTATSITNDQTRGKNAKTEVALFLHENTT